MLVDERNSYVQEEIGRLRAEMAQLQSQMRELQQRAFAPKCGEKDADDDKELYTNVLHNVVKKQQNTFVDIQAVMSGYTACVRVCLQISLTVFILWAFSLLIGLVCAPIEYPVWESYPAKSRLTYR